MGRELLAPRKSQGVRYSIERVPESAFGLGSVEKIFFIEVVSGARSTARDPRDSAAAWRASRASVTGTWRTWMVIGVFKSISVMILSLDWLVKDRRTEERGFLSKTSVMVPQP
jgi:hypothetical protein